MIAELGISLFLSGLLLMILVWAVIRIMPGSPAAMQASAGQYSYSDSSSSKDSMIILQPGGRVDYISAPARAFFDLRENEPYDLERLARRVRPSEDFLDLCAEPGSKRVTIHGKPVEITSFKVPGVYPIMLVSLRGRDFPPSLEPGSTTSNEVLRTVTEFSQNVSSSLNLDSTIFAILDYVSRSVPSEMLEIKLWVEPDHTLIPYRFKAAEGHPGGSARVSTSQFGSFTDLLVSRRVPMLISDARSQPELSGGNDFQPIQSYLGIPLYAGGEFIGVLEAGQTAAGSFGQHDLDFLQLIAGQTAVAIRNAKLFDQEQKRATELAGLANLNRSLGSIRDTQDLFSQLIENITPLFEVEIVGFLLYDDEKRVLEGKIPFRGLPSHFVEIYRTSIMPGSPAEQILLNRKAVITSNAITDDSWRALDLIDIAQAASLRDNALIPLVSSGRMMGYMQIGHHKDGSPSFNANELRLMNIIASQAAAIIENALLVQQARIRARRADALRRITSLAGSSATLSEILKFSVHELAQLFQADVGVVFLMDEARGELLLDRTSVYGLSENAGEKLVQVYVEDPYYRETVSGSQRPFTTGNLSLDPRVLPAYRPLSSTLQLESALIVPLVTRERGIGELVLGSAAKDYFSSEDLQIALTAAGQLATAVETTSLRSQTDESLRRRISQLSAIMRVSLEVGAAPDIHQMLQAIHQESMHVIHADCASILLLEAETNPQELRVAYSVGCSETRDLSSLERRVLQTGESQVVGDFSLDGIPAPHAKVNSAIIMPLKSHAHTIGLISLHSDQPNFFSPDTVELAQSLAAHAGIVVNNARKYQVEKQRSDRMSRQADTLVRLTNVSHSLGSDQPLDQILSAIAGGIRDSSPFRVVLISMVEPETGLLRRVCAVGIPPDTLNEILIRKQPLASVQQLLKPEFKISRSYFIPADQTPVVPSDVHMVTLNLPKIAADGSPDAWNPEDFLLVPLENAEGRMIGLISLDDPSNGLRPDQTTIQQIEVFAIQAALVISQVARTSELQTRIDALASGIQRQQKLLKLTQNDLPILLRKDLDQTISLHELDRRAQRVRAGLAITESVSRQLDASSALSALGRETLTQLGMTVALIAENTVEGPRLLHVMGSLPRSVNVEALFGQRNPLRICLQVGKPILISNLDEDEEWREISLLTSLRAKGVICLPVLIEGKPVAAMLAMSPEPMPVFTDEDRQVYLQISQQTSLILQNISLLNQTRRRLDEVNLLLDFSRQLSGLNPDAMVNSLLESARRVIQNAHAGAVLVWNPQNEVLVPRAVSGYADNVSMSMIHYRLGEALPGMVFLNKITRRVDEINFPRDYNLSAENLALYRQATGGRLPVSSLMVPVLAGDQGLGLLVLDNFNTPSAFRPEDEALLLSLAQQVALSLDNVRLVQATQERAGQLQALNNAAAALTSSLRSDQLVSSLLDQLAPVVPYDTATLWLRDRDRLEVVSTRGFPDADQRLGLSVSVSDSALFKEMAQSGQPILVNDVREDPRFVPVEAPRLSWLGIPLISKGELVGALAVEKWQAHFYSREQMQVGLTFASQSAVSLDNARLYEDSVSRATELDQRSKRLATINRFASALTGLLDTDEILDLTSEELLKGLGARRVSMVTFDRGQAIWRTSSPRTRYKLPRELPPAPIFNRLKESLGIFNTDDVWREPDLAPLVELLGENTTAMLVLPLASGSNLSAMIFCHMTGTGRFAINEVELARTMSNQAAIALENARLYQSSVQTAERLSTLNQASANISASFNLNEIYQTIHHASERLMPVDVFLISLLDESTNEIETVFQAGRGSHTTSRRVPIGRGLAGQVIEKGTPLLLQGPFSTGSESLAIEVDGEPSSVLAVPMILVGKAVGMLSVQNYKPNAYSEEDLQILGTLANQAIVAIQNARLFAEIQALASQLEARVVERTAQLQREQQNTETLLRILTEVSSSLDLDRALNRTLSMLNEAIGAEQGTIMLVHAEDNLLHYRAGYGYLTDRTETGTRGFTMRIGEGLAGWVVQNREAVLVNDLRQDPRWVRSSKSGQDHRSAIIVPMLVGEDVIGVLMVFQRIENFFSSEMLNLVKAIASQVAVAINNAHLYELIRDQAERLGVMLRKEQEEASRSQAILEAVADGVLVTGPDDRITFVNSSTERILALEETQMLGSPLDSFVGMFGKAASEWMQTIQHWSENPASYELGDTYAEQLELENGRIALVHLAPVILQNDFLGTVSIFRDITHEVEVDRLKSEFVATVSHELRTPMTAIKGYVDILVMGAAGALNENQTHFLDIVRSNIDRLNTLVGDLLDISRIESGRVTLNPQPVDLCEVAEDVIQEVQRRAQNEKKPMDIALDVPAKVPPVLGDAERVRQILGNLVDNAYHYTPENGRIRVGIHLVNGDVQVDVQDTGVGVAPEDQARVFDRFFRGENPMVLATPGTGLGLPIVRQLIEMHNGRIWMTSTGIAGEGSTFSFTLPVHK